MWKSVERWMEKVRIREKVGEGNKKSLLRGLWGKAVCGGS